MTMPDRDTVVRGLHDIAGFIAGRIGIERARNFLRTIDDALELLKEQEAVEPIETGFKVPVKVRFDYECICRAPMLKDQPFCMGCGRKVKWDA